MITPVSLKSDLEPFRMEMPRFVLSEQTSFSLPPFNGAEFREARIFAEPGDLLKVELLFVCKKLPSKEELYIDNQFCRYNDLKTGIIECDIPSCPDWNGTYNAKVGWHWVTVFCFLSDFAISAYSGGWNDMRSRRQSRGGFQDYHQESARNMDNMSSCAQA